ncbi:Zinc finger protein CONSTANS-LIKE 5 [Acorus calamus]|uniref:Zinc finger protein CONSTANS-LIKE 5 n=1 Tax=Acorus calamus TaxID=4465 RepID=A0AAV9F4C2_ACOCL|nr:Zinc finger protein CONSTANS-LIKE 5 [Acorus calamus]
MYNCFHDNFPPFPSSSASAASDDNQGYHFYSQTFPEFSTAQHETVDYDDNFHSYYNHYVCSVEAAAFSSLPSHLERSSSTLEFPPQHVFPSEEHDSMRRALSAGDLHQRMNSLQLGRSNSESPVANESSRVGRYSAEERRERIERYRTKRNQRNFHKKITYACRKTLADSRPRVRGRFARNGEMGESSQSEWRQMDEEEDSCCYEEEEWMSLLEMYSNSVP